MNSSFQAMMSMVMERAVVLIAAAVFVPVMGGCTRPQAPTPPARVSATPPAPAAPPCSGCKKAEACLPGSTQDACGKGGLACAVCLPDQDCKQGTCVNACNKDSCTGCCDHRQCSPGDKPNACGKDGQGCMNCGSKEVCYDGTCMTKAIKAEQQRQERLWDANRRQLESCLKKVEEIRARCSDYEERNPPTAAVEDVVARCQATADRIEAKCEYYFEPK